MKIDNISSVYGVYNTNTSPVSKKSKTEMKKDDFEISANAKDFQFALKAVSSAPDVREDVVEKVKARLDSGNYSVSPGMIADRILSLS